MKFAFAALDNSAQFGGILNAVLEGFKENAEKEKRK
jgi:hypothetical protein